VPELACKASSRRESSPRRENADATVLPVVLQREVKLLDGSITRSQSSVTVPAKIVICILQVISCVLKGVERLVDFGVMFVAKGLRLDRKGQGHEQPDGNSAGGEQFLHTVGIDGNRTGRIRKSFGFFGSTAPRKFL